MEALLLELLENLPTLVLVLIIAATLVTLSKGADILVDEAVSLSIHWGIPKMVIGATIVSLGTTLPEATVSVLAAINGNPDLALGNAIGSVIADTGLILGLAAMIGLLPIDPLVVKRQGKIQLGAAILLAVVSLPVWGHGNGRIFQWMGFLFVALLVAYIYMSLKWARQDAKTTGTVDLMDVDEEEELVEDKSPVYLQIFKLIIGTALVIASSKVLIPSVEITAIRVGIPQSIIAATLIAFGTSLPELITAITAVRKGHGELAIGNIVGADILNVLFVVGSAAAVTKGGLEVPVNFYQLQIPAMIIILVMFRIFSVNKEKVLNKKMGIALFVAYMIYLILNFTWLS